MSSDSLAETYDHNGHPAHHGRARVNGIRMHYITSLSPSSSSSSSSPSSSPLPPLLLLHGVPKNSFYWYRLWPLLTPYFTLVAPDLRGFGYTDKPPPAPEGYDSKTAAKDVVALMTQLGHESFHVHGEDRGADYAYAVAGLYRDRVKSLSFGEMLLSGLGLEESSFWTKENVTAQFRQEGVWCWVGGWGCSFTELWLTDHQHLPFFYIPHIPEMLIQGHEREFWEMFMRQECYNPTTIEPKALNHWIECVKQPGCLRGILESYRAGFKNGEIHQELAKTKLTIPVMTIGAPEFFGPKVKECAERFAENVAKSEIYEECGHSLALEKPERLAKDLIQFMLGK